MHIDGHHPETTVILKNVHPNHRAVSRKTLSNFDAVVHHYGQTQLANLRSVFPITRWHSRVRGAHFFVLGQPIRNGGNQILVTFWVLNSLQVPNCHLVDGFSLVNGPIRLTIHTLPSPQASNGRFVTFASILAALWARYSDTG